MDPSLLTEDQAASIVRTGRDLAGDRLRSVTYFRQDDFEQVYLREDLEQDADLTTFIGLEWREADITENAYQGTELGEHVYTLRRFDNGYLLRVSTHRDGVFVTMDGLSLSGFEDLAAALADVVGSLREPDE